MAEPRCPHDRTRPPALALACLLAVATPAGAAPEFRLSFDPRLHAEPFTGRVYVLLTAKEPRGGPAAGPDWFHPEPIFAADVKDWRPGAVLALPGAALRGYPTPPAGLPRGTYWVQAVLDFDRGARSFAAAEGNLYSRPVRHTLAGSATESVRLVLDQVYHEPPLKETERVKLVEVESRLLSAFHGRPVRLRAGVGLPASFDREPARRYPVVYEVPGFGADHFVAFKAARRDATDVAGVEMVHVVLDPGCRWGHHAFADSDNNGPCGRALVEEMIPAVEKRFRGLGRPGARFVTGHSSGGWSSLWLQITYPDVFGGVWSTAPDPVDYRAFQRINLYAPGVNAFRDDRGRPWPVARRQGKSALTLQPFCEMEEVMGHGGQFGSFDAVFGPRGPDGRPVPLWDRKTGRVDPAVLKAWQRYDIRVVLERNWPALGPKLAGRLHVYTGAEDTFYLDGATALLKGALARLGSDAVVEVFPGRDHLTLLDAALRRRIAREMAEEFRRRYPQPAPR
jgi:S-formylglutathione hydrolase FrmB